ncbi:MAG: amino acid adenylation domain-containing protein, partial [Candidatus Methanomethylophilaceae archaeon]|nr:amino acid adenylation domain-containing protein [Candidatus Methanomethylophilaceae archaeon]
ESRRILISDLRKAFSGIPLDKDLGFLLSVADAPDADYIDDAMSFFDAAFDDERDLPVFDNGGAPGSATVRLGISVGDIPAGATAGTFFAAAFGYTLSRFSGSSKAVFPMTEMGRDLPGTENAIGMFVRTFPVAIDCSDRPVSDFVSASADSVLGSMSFSKLPFMEVANRYCIDMSVSFEYMAGINADFRSLSAEFSADGQSADPVSDLFLAVSESEGGFSASVQHSGRFSHDTSLRFLDSFSRIVSGLVSCERLSDIRYTSDEDVALLEGINGTSAPLRFSDILEAFRRQVAASPDSPLLTYLDRCYTYAEVDRASDSIASALSSQGVRPGDRAAVMVPRSEWYMLCALGVLKTGAAYVPVDTSYPDERVSFMLSDSSVRAVLVTEETSVRSAAIVQALQPSPCVVSCTGLPASGFEPVSISPQDAALILYTSGTTGTPKGSAIPHLAVESYVEFYARATGMRSDDVVALYHSYGFDVHLESMFSPIIVGASVSLIPEDVRLDIDMLHRYVEDCGITNLHLPTALGTLFVDRHPVSRLKQLVVGGEKFRPPERDVSYRLMETYGPTEATVSVTYCDVCGGEHPESVGLPVSNTSVYILDGEHRRVPVGAVGELFLSGYQLSSGYLNNPEKNASAFFHNPFSSEKGYERMYATGDFFRLLPDGTLGIIGRRDGQVKVRGNRVELTEVEACLRSFPGISNVTVQPVVAENGTKELCAYVVSDSPVSAAEVQAFVSGRKPDYMVPAFVVRMDSIPLNVNGKVDRRALPKPDLASLRAGYAAPRNGSERILCEAFAQALGVDKVGIDDDFIRLGGDSLKATGVASIFNTQSDSHILARDILRRRTVREISSDMRTAHAEDNVYSLELGHPPTMSQKDVIEYMQETGLSLNIATAVCLGDLLDAETILPILEALIATTPDLRMHVVKRDGDPYILYDADVEITVDSCDPEEFAAGFVRPFTPYSPCLARLAIIEHESQCHLFIDVCHLIFDGRSIEPLVSRLMSILGEETPPMDDGLLRQAEYDRGYMATPLYKERVQGLVRLLEGSDDIYEDSEPSESDTGLETPRLSLTSDDMSRILAALDTGPSDVFYCAFSYAMNKVYGKDKLFYIIEDGRGDVDVSDSVGVFMRLHPIRIRKHSDDVFGYVRDAMPQIDETMSYSDISLADVREYRHLWPDVVIQYNNYLSALDGDLPELDIRILKPLARSPFRIHVNVNPVEGGFAVLSTYAENQSGDTVREILAEFDAFLSELAKRV